jgi:hypothetical protein
MSMSASTITGIGAPDGGADAGGDSGPEGAGDTAAGAHPTSRPATTATSHEDRRCGFMRVITAARRYGLVTEAAAGRARIVSYVTASAWRADRLLRYDERGDVGDG